MKNLNQIEQLDLRIMALKQQQREDFQDMKAEFHEIVTSLTPANLIKQAFRNIATKETLISAVTGILGGYLTKKVVEGNSESPVRKILGNVVQLAVTTILSIFSNRKMEETEE
nr:hypothetical protein [uncultured Flavobacterium sp.]